MLRGIVTILLILVFVPLNAGCGGGVDTKKEDSSNPAKTERKLNMTKPLPPPPPLKKG
jgi:hypothetical protein